jgi:hypothetical protein
MVEKTLRFRYLVFRKFIQVLFLWKEWFEYNSKDYSFITFS